MTQARRCCWIALGAIELLVLLAALTRPAYGYVDPGSGLLAIQVGGSMLAGALFLIRTKLRKLLRISPPVENASQENVPAEPGS
jgi:hypothetical protein